MRKLLSWNIRKGKQSNKKLKISVKFFLLFSLVTTISIGSIALFFSLYFSRILVDREITNFRTLNTSFLNQIENEIRVMDDASVNILYSSLVQDTFSRYIAIDSDKISVFSNLIDIFVAVNGANFSLPIISVYSNDGDKVSVGAYSTREKVDLSSLPWVEKADEYHYRKYLSLPYSSTAMQTSKRVAPYYISLYRTMRNQFGVDTGYIETAQYADDIFQSIIDYRKLTESSLTLLVFNEAGRLVYPYEETAISSDLQEYYYKSAEDEAEPKIFRNPFTGDRELLFAQSSSYTDWTYICFQDTKSLLLPVRNVSRLLILATILVLLIATTISYYLAKSITSPIRDLLKKIDTTSIDTLSEGKHHFDSSYNEFDELNDAFHDMSANLKESMDELIHSRQREMESRFLALQAQINPHFYYNSLSSIIALTESGKPDDVIQFCSNLSQIMRYAAQRNPATVSIATEISIAEKYLYCMKVRYQSSLCYSIDIDDRLKDFPIPRLIIQPLVENAIKYGTNCPPPWNISITSRDIGNGWIIEVCDSGTGFSDEAIRNLCNKIDNWNSGAKMPFQKGEGGLGLINVYSRWRIFCGPKFTFTFENRDKGACVAIGQTGGTEG